MRILKCFRFKLKTLIVIVSCLSVWLALQTESARRQRNAVQAVEDYGGWVRYDYQYPSGNYSSDNGFDANAVSGIPSWLIEFLGVDFFHRVVSANLCYTDDDGPRLENENRNANALRTLRPLRHLRVLMVAGTQVTDETMGELVKFPRLECLVVWDASHLTDEGVSALARMTSLKRLQFDETHYLTDSSLEILGRLHRLEKLVVVGGQFTDRGLEQVAQLSELRELSLAFGSTPFTDEGLTKLNKLRQLEVLQIQGNITDAGLKNFESISSLKTLMLHSNQASSEGFTALRSRLPTTTCELYHEMQTGDGEVIWGMQH